MRLQFLNHFKSHGSKSRYLGLMAFVLLFAYGNMIKGQATYKEISHTFFTSDNLYKMYGTILIPNQLSKNSKCIVLVSPPFAFDEHYFTLFDKISAFLASEGNVVLKYNNRNYTYIHFGRRISMKDQADDAIAAIISLSKYSKFKFMPKGLLGHSEGADASIMAAIKSNVVTFCILLAPMGENGDVITNYQRDRYIERNAPLLSDEIKEKIKNNNRALIKIAKSESQIKNIVKRSVEKQVEFYRDNPDVVLAYNNIADSINQSQKTTKLINKEVQYSRIDTGFAREIAKKEYTSFFTKGQVDFIKYEPERTFSKISIPYLALFASADALDRPEISVKNLNEIAKHNGHKCSTIKLIQNVDHQFAEVLEKNSGTELIGGNISQSTISAIRRWLSVDFNKCSK